MIIVVLLHIPLGDFIARVYSSTRDWRVETVVYRLVGVDSSQDQHWTRYLRSLLAFSAVGVLFLYGFLLVQTLLPAPWGHHGRTPALAFHTAVSFTTNTSWQNYAGESTLGHVGLATGLGVQAYASAAVGMCAAIALVRGIARSQAAGVGNFWVDLVRTIVRILLPLSFVVAMLLIPLSLVRTFAVMVCDKRQGRALLVVVAVLFALGVAAVVSAETMAHGTVAAAAGSASEGTEMRFGITGSAVFGQAATASADGAANASYDSFASLGGAMLMVNMMLGEVGPGGAGSGLYGLVMMVLLAVFLGGLMIGRTPEYLGKRLNAREMKFVSVYILVAPITILVGCALAMALPDRRRSMLNTGPHGLSEVLLRVHQFSGEQRQRVRRIHWEYPIVQRRVVDSVLIGRYVPIIVVLALAGSVAAQRPGVATAGSLRTHSPVFVGLIVAVTLIMVGLEYFPALALGPLADGLG